jgi:hypothetical protein
MHTGPIPIRAASVSDRLSRDDRDRSVDFLGSHRMSSVIGSRIGASPISMHPMRACQSNQNPTPKGTDTKMIMMTINHAIGIMDHW